MNPRIAELNGSNICYFDRIPERLVLEGYRRWIAGFETGSVLPWEMTWALYHDAVGVDASKALIAELSQFVRVLRHCALCPLHSFPFDSHQVCQAECLTLGLISAMQNGDTATIDACLGSIACKSRCLEVEKAAQDFADALMAADQILLPIPTNALLSALSRTSAVTVH